MSASTAPEPRPDPVAILSGSTRYVYGILDLLFAAVYLFVFLRLVPSRSTAFTAIAVVVSLALAAGGVGMFLWGRWGRRLAAGAAIMMLAVCVLLLLGLAASAAYLHGIYDGIGEAGVAISGVVAALTLELLGLLPLLQLVYLWRTRTAEKRTS